MTAVLDAQAVLAYFQGEKGAESVRDLLDDVAAGEDEAWCNTVNLGEVSYVLLRREPSKAEALVRWLLDVGVKPASAEETWREAAAIKAAHTISIADAFALATARQKRGVLVAGNDPDFDIAPELGVELMRIA